MKRHLLGSVAIALLVCLSAFSANAQIMFTFDNPADLTNNFNSTNPQFIDGGTSGIGGTAAVQNPFVGYNYSQVDLWTLKTGIPTTGNVFTVSATFYNNSDGGYAGLGFATTNTNAPVGKGETANGLGMLTHAGGGFFTNNAVETPINYSGDQLEDGNWYQIMLTVTRTGASTFTLEFQIRNSDANGVPGVILTDEIATGVVNPGFGAAETVYPYFSADASRMSLIDNFSEPQMASRPLGSGTSEDPYLVGTLDNLFWLTQNSGEFGKVFKQTADIDASSTRNWNAGSGWTPIGNESLPFSGTYDGNGKTISGLFINRSSICCAFFGETNGGAISNLGLVNVYIHGDNFSGALVGINSAKITNCFSTGTVIGYGTAGGLMGDSQADSVNCSYSTCNVTAYNEGGGFIGEASGHITNCYSRGNVTRVAGDPSVDLGAFVGGYYSGKILNCYSTGRVLSTGAPDPTDNGFVGSNFDGEFGGEFGGDFWDIESSLQLTDVGGAVGLTTALMKSQATFLDAGWSSDEWNLDAGFNDGYPHLKWQNPTGSPLPIQLASFTASPVAGSSVKLLWKTASEVNNYGFYVERSSNKSTGFVAVSGLIPGHGTSTTGYSYQYADKSVPAGNQYYRLKQVDLDNAVHYSDPVMLSTTGVAESAPIVFALSQNYPNPFNPSTQFRFSVAKTGFTTLVIYNAIGQEVSRIFNGPTEAGKYYTARLDGTGLASGVYFARLQSGIEAQMKKIVLMK